MAWHLSRRRSKRYVGKLLSTRLAHFGEALKDIWDIPPELDRDVVYCMLDGSDFGTIVWPRFSRQEIKRFQARTIDTEIRTLVKGLHIDAHEKSVSEITLLGPIFALLHGLKGYDHEIRGDPLVVSIRSTPANKIAYKLQVGACEFGLRQTYSPKSDHLSAEVRSTGTCRVVFDEPLSIVDALAFAQKLEAFFSLICCSYVRAANFEIRINDLQGDEEDTGRAFNIHRAHFPKRARFSLERHELPFRLPDINFACAANNFLSIFDTVEQTLNWYRIVVAEDRYLEDKFFYCIRMIEATYRNLEIEAAADHEGLSYLERIREQLDVIGSHDLLRFLDTRVVPIFQRPLSLSDIIRDLKKRYAGMKAVGLLSEKMIGKLRGKEAHGTAQAFASSEYSFMANCMSTLLMLYRLVILERCGLPRDYLLSQLQNAKHHAFSDLFSERWVKEVEQAIGDGS